MFGKKSGLVTLLKKDNPQLIAWPCAAHRLELAMADALDQCTQTNHFKTFMDKIYTTYSMSPKNQRELAEVAKELEVEVLKNW